MVAAVATSLVTASCATVGLPTAVPSPTLADLEAQGPTSQTTAPAAPLEAPPGIIASVSKRGLFISWLAVEGATDGYVVAIDDAWYAVPDTKVRFTSIFPGLKYEIKVAAVANGIRGPAVTTTVKKGSGVPPREIIKGRPTPSPSLASPLASPTPVISPSPTPTPTPSPATSAPASPAETASASPTPVTVDREIVAIRSNGCGFTADGVVDLRITVRLAKGEGQAPVALVDTRDRRYEPDPEAGTTNKLVFVPVATEEPPGGAAVTIARYRGEDADTTNDVEITPVEWGYQLCDQPVENPRWQ
jgi:cell division septation protein DedD